MKKIKEWFDVHIWYQPDRSAAMIMSIIVSIAFWGGFGLGWCLSDTNDQPTYVEQTQPPVEDDILCYDFATGHVYSCFKRDDGNVQLRINPEGNLVIAKLIEHETPTEVVKEE